MEVEGLAVPHGRLLRRQLGQGPVAGPAGVVEGPVDLHGPGRRHPVPGELGHPVARVVPAELLQRRRYPLVGPHPALPAQLVVEHVLDQRMGEREPVGPAADRRITLDVDIASPAI